MLSRVTRGAVCCYIARSPRPFLSRSQSVSSLCLTCGYASVRKSEEKPSEEGREDALISGCGLLWGGCPLRWCFLTVGLRVRVFNLFSLYLFGICGFMAYLRVKQEINLLTACVCG